MEYLVGITLALFFCAAAAGLGMDRERAFYPAVLIAVASYYLAFAVVDGRHEVMLSEIAIAAVFIAAAVAGFKRSPWIAVVALGGHGVMDAFHHHLVHKALRLGDHQQLGDFLLAILGEQPRCAQHAQTKGE